MDFYRGVIDDVVRGVRFEWLPQGVESKVVDELKSVRKRETSYLFFFTNFFLSSGRPT